MRNWIIRWLIIGSGALIPTPALAANWVHVGRTVWIDMDSVVHTGTLVGYLVAYGEASPAVSGAEPVRVGIDCATRRIYTTSFITHQLIPQTTDDTADGYEYRDAADPVFRLLCR